MKTNKLDNNIKEKLQNRTFKPSASAWERLSIQLDEQPQQKKRGWFFYIGAAASILLLVAIGLKIFSSNKEIITPNVIIVDNPIDTVLIDHKIKEFINEVPVEEALVKVEKVEEKLIKVIDNRVIAKKIKQPVLSKKIKLVAQVEEKETKITNSINVTSAKDRVIKIQKQDPNSRIKINSEDLLFAVTHSPKQVEEYYANNNLTRNDVLKTIESELKKSNIKVNPNSILAEVERTIGEEDFQNNFMKSIKKRVSNIATALASRNN